MGLLPIQCVCNHLLDKEEDADAASGSTLGKKVELISPMPTKKSSVSSRGISNTQKGHIHLSFVLTGNNFDEIGTPFPHVCSVIDNNDHGCITGKESL